MKRGYHTLLSKPLDQYFSNVVVNSHIELLSWQALDLGLGWSVSVALTSLGLRLAGVPFGALLDRVQWVPPEFLKEPLQNAHKSFILNNLEYDVKKLKLVESQHKQLKAQVEGRTLLKQFILGYMGLGYFRALHHMCFTPEHYSGLADSSFLGFALCSYDPFFIMPLVFGACNYFLLKKSFHPFTIKLTENSIFWIAFCSSLASVFTPVAYIEAWVSLAATHILLKQLIK